MSQDSVGVPHVQTQAKSLLLVYTIFTVVFLVGACMHACIYIYICYLCTCKASSFKLFHFVFVLPCCSQSFKASPSHSGHGRQRKSERPWALSRSLPVPSHYTFHRRASPRRPRSRDFPSDCQWQNLRHTNQVLVCSRITVRSP